MSGERRAVILAGAVIGAMAVLLVHSGNPGNMGFCIACFLRDIAGGLGLHRAAAVQYIRPEIPGLVLGAFIISLSTREFQVTGGAGALLRFVIGALVMIGALVFLGCPLRMVLRLAGGDLNAIGAVLGFVAGIWVGVQFLKGGFSLGSSAAQNPAGGAVMPVLMLLLLGLVVWQPNFIFFSEEGPGALYAPVSLSLGAGIVVGILAQRSRLCMAGGIRDMILFRDPHLLWGFVAILVVAFLGNLSTGLFNLGFSDQPASHSDFLWNFLGMSVVGLGSVLLGGCPLRQLILAGEGNLDSAIAVLGMLAGAAIAHNFGMASAPAGPSLEGKVAVIIALVILGLVGYTHSEAVKRRKKKWTELSTPGDVPVRNQ